MPRLIIFTTALVALVTAANPSAKAESRFDGRWSAVLETKSGPCDAAYRGAVQVTNGIVQAEGVANNVLSGRVSPNGSVTVRGTMAATLYGIAWGRLSGNSGAGSWRVQMQNEKCFGVRTARRLSLIRTLRLPFRWQKCTPELCIYRVLFVTTVTVLSRDQCFVVLAPSSPAVFPPLT
jgi:hypothetical protein